MSTTTTTIVESSTVPGRTDDELRPQIGAGIVNRRQSGEQNETVPNSSAASEASSYLETSVTGLQTPDALLHPWDALTRVPTAEREARSASWELERVYSSKSNPHMGETLEKLANTMSNPQRDGTDESYELRQTVSRRAYPGPERRRPSRSPAAFGRDGLAEEVGSPTKPVSQGVPPELRNFTAEIVFVLVCSAGQLLFAWLLGDVNVNQFKLQHTLSLPNTQLPWLQGAFNISNGLSVIISGSLTDLAPPRWLLVGAFCWLTVWNIVGVFSLNPSRSVLFFIVRAMQGAAVGVLASGSMSILGRVYKPGMRKTRVFSSMAAMAPFGFWLGAMQGGALTAHLSWIFGTNAIVCGLCAVAAYLTIPALKPAADTTEAEAPSIKHFDYVGAGFAVLGSVCLLFGLTQGSVASWAPYTYILVIVGLALLLAFFFVERKVARPLIPARLWKTRGFTPLMIAYFLGFGSFIGPWQFYAIQFWLRIQRVSPLTAALYLLPNAILGVLATFLVSRILHVVPGHWIFATSMVAFGLGPVFFLPQTASTAYWALSMPGVALTTFGPDLSFAAASIFITSNVARSYQGSAGSLLMTVQNLSAAIMTSVGDAIGSQVDLQPDGQVGLDGLKAIWWFGFGAAMVGAVITIAGVRIPKEEEKEHVT